MAHDGARKQGKIGQRVRVRLARASKQVELVGWESTLAVKVGVRVLRCQYLTLGIPIRLNGGRRQVESLLSGQTLLVPGTCSR